MLAHSLPRAPDLHQLIDCPALSLSLSLSLQHEDFLLALQVNEDEYKKVGFITMHLYLLIQSKVAFQ